MAGHKRYRAGAWRFTVEGPRDPITGKRKPIYRTFHAPNTREGAKAADVALAQLVVEVDVGKALAGSGVTTGQMLEQWVELRRAEWEEKSPGQPDENLRRIRLHLIPHIGDVPLRKLRPIDITTLYAKLRAAGQSGGSVRRIHNILHAALVWAEQNELRPEGLAAKMSRPEAAPPKPEAPTSAEVSQLIGAAGDQLALYLRIAALTGARRGQMCAIRWSHLDLDKGTIRWTRALAVVKGGVAEKSTKSGNEWPVALDEGTVTLLRKEQLRARERALSAGVALPDDAYVFCRDTAGVKPWHPSGATQRFGALRAKLSLEHVKLKHLRNYLVTEMLDAGADPTVVAHRGGWSNKTTPLTIYAAFRPARDQAAATHLAAGLDQLPAGGADQGQ